MIGLCVWADSLSEVVPVSPEWWTLTAKANTVVGLVLDLGFAHSLGLLHGHSTGRNVILNGDGVIQIADFCMKHLREQEWNSGGMLGVGGFLEEDWTPTADIRAFTAILSQITMDRSGVEGVGRPDVPGFLSSIIKRGLSGDSRIANAFREILLIVKPNFPEWV
jgi:hypothetical protein